MKKWMALLGVVALLLWLLWGNMAVVVTEYTVESSRIPAAFSGFRIAQISDLHNTSFGRDNCRLLGRLRDTQPDLIVITGDMIDYFHPDVDTALAFAAAAAQIAPVYYVTGNHEAALHIFEELKAALPEIGVIPLENEKVSLERGGEEIALIGLVDLGYFPVPRSDNAAAMMESLKQGDDRYTILLEHRPELFDAYVSACMDLVLSGHAHGGQFRIPLIGGLYSPSQGWFPRYDAGQFTMGRTHMIVSRGLGNSRFPLRINNPPEIVVVELCSVPAD